MANRNATGKCPTGAHRRSSSHLTHDLTGRCSRAPWSDRTDSELNRTRRIRSGASTTKHSPDSCVRACMHIMIVGSALDDLDYPHVLHAGRPCKSAWRRPTFALPRRTTDLLLLSQRAACRAWGRAERDRRRAGRCTLWRAILTPAGPNDLTWADARITTESLTPFCPPSRRLPSGTTPRSACASSRNT